MGRGSLPQALRPTHRIPHAASTRRAIVRVMNPADPVASSPSAAHPPLDPRVRFVLFAAVFLVAVALRVEYVCEIWPHPAAQLPILDAEAYRKIALEIRAGDWLGDAVYYLDPLYPFFLAAIYSIVEPDTRGVLLVQALLDSLSVVFVMLIARRAFGDRSALAAGAIAATYSLFFYYDGLLQKEALMIFLLVAGLYAIVRAAESARARAWLPAGGLIGLAALTRGNSLLFVPTLLLWIAVQGRGTRRARGLAALCFSPRGLAFGPVHHLAKMEFQFSSLVCRWRWN